MSIHEIEARALQLPPDQRAALARQLIASLDAASETEEMWAEEAARRSAALGSGDAEPVAAATVFAQARQAVS